MPKILKFYEQDETVQSYSFPLDFSDEVAANTILRNEGDGILEQFDKVEEEPEPEPSASAEEADRMLEEAKKEAEEIIRKAEEEAETLKQNAEEAGRKEGYEAGYEEGFSRAYAEGQEKTDRDAKDFLLELRTIITQATDKKDDMLRQYSGDLRDISVAIAEKVIQVGLKSSGKVIEKMIIAATEKIKNKQWAKIYIAKCDAEIVLQGDANLLEALSHVSEHVKIVVIENESPGTCIIELPDEIIDASASTQVENIKGILQSTGI